MTVLPHVGSTHRPHTETRFVVSSTTGYRDHQKNGTPITEWLVLDRLNAMRVVWRSHDINKDGVEFRRHRGDQETIARNIAAQFERSTRGV